MFRSEGADRSDRLNRMVAGYLAFIGGFVNSCGVVLLGMFTSHVTGNIGRGALELASIRVTAALAPAAMVLSFYLGALSAHLVLDSVRFGRPVSHRYGSALFIEASLIAAFAFGNAPALLLCAAMGLQNSLVTRLSGAIVRTTHLTGVITDLGIETARWIRHWRYPRTTERPPVAKLALLGTIVSTFGAGALMGSAMTLLFARGALAVPILALVAAAAYARR